MKWASAFKYIPVNYDDRVATAEKLTQRVSFDNNLDGDLIRLRFSNRYGKSSLRLDRVSIGVENGRTVTNTVLVTANGSSVITLEPGQEIYSDEISFAARAGKRLAVSIYINQAQDIESICCLWSKTNTLVSFGAGDLTSGQMSEETQPGNILSMIRDDPSPCKAMFFYGFDALQVLTDDSVKIIAAFGDSITHMSFVTNALMKRLYAACPGKVTLINCGIGGNRLVHDATFVRASGRVISVFGDAGVKRFEHDVFELDKADTVLSLIGINDIMHPVQLEELTQTTPAEDIIEGCKTIAAIAHAHRARIFGATVMPCGSRDFLPDGLPIFEKTRQRLNEWLRSTTEYDGVFDYDASIRDPACPGFLLPGTHIGDGLHPNDKGGEIIAGTINLVELTGLK